MSKRSQKPVKAAASVPTGYGPLLAELAFAQAWGGDVILQQPAAKLAVGNATSPEEQSTGNDSLTGVGESVRPNVSQPVIPLPGGKRSQPATESPTATGAIVQQVVGESSGSILQQAVALSPATPPEPVASLPWGHNLVVLTKLKKPAERLWYAQAALRHGWSRAVLTVQIETQAHRRMSANAYTEDQLVEQHAIGLFAEFGGHNRRTRDLLPPPLLSGRVELDVSLGMQQTSGAVHPA